MAPLTDIEPRADNTQGGTIMIAVIAAIGGAVIVSFFVVTILLIRKRRRASKNNLPYHVTTSPLSTHKANISDASVKPLLVDDPERDWDFKEKFTPPTRQSTGDVTREDRDVLSNNPNGLYHIPSIHTLRITSFSPSPSSICLPHGSDTKTSSEYHGASLTPVERLSLPQPPPLVIPDSRFNLPYSQPRHSTAVDGEMTLPSQPPSSPSSTTSYYSQFAAEPTPSAYETSYPSPLSQELGYDAPQAGEELHRDDTQLVGILLRARAQRNPDGLVRTGSQVSHIERSGSIKSVASIHHDNRPYAKRYRSKKRNVTDQVGEMEVVKETSEVGSLRSRSDSSSVHPWDPSLVVQLPPPVAGPRSSLRQKA